MDSRKPTIDLNTYTNLLKSEEILIHSKNEQGVQSLTEDS